MTGLATHTRRLVVLLLVPAALAVTVAGFGGDDDAGAVATAPASTTSTAQGNQAWERVVPGGDCRCADGSEFSFWVREVSRERVVLYLQDGGACFSAETCAPERDLYNTKIEEGPTREGGIFDFADARNPFADYSVIYVP